MNDDLHQAAARAVLVEHYARLLEPLEHERDLILTRPPGTDTEADVAGYRETLDELEASITMIRQRASEHGVTFDLDRVLSAQMWERDELARRIADGLAGSD